METKHTKAGLLYTKNPGSIVVHDYEMYAICDIWYDESNEDEALANAKLIAAAPLLLEALIKVYSKQVEQGKIGSGEVLLMINAIKKATE